MKYDFTTVLDRCGHDCIAANRIPFEGVEVEEGFDAIVCDVTEFHKLNEKYGQRFGDLVLRSIGISLLNLARRTGGIGCRKEGDAFLLYCPHQDEYEQLLERFMADVFLEEDTAEKVRLRFGIYEHAQQETDIEDRCARAKDAADHLNGQQLYAIYEPTAE